MKAKEFNVIISGIGGQGVITLANVIEEAAAIDGYDVSGSELHGLSMRFGSLECHVRFGRKVYSPLVARGEADLIISLELLEALRVAHFVNRKTKFIVNESKIKPTSVYFGGYSYPSVDEIKEKLEKVCDVFFVPASERVKEFGEVYSNAFLLGFARSFLPIDERAIMAAMRKLPNFEINKRVYELAKSF